MIYYHTPTDTNGNIGNYYNLVMDRIDFYDWVVFTDRDTLFPNPFYFNLIEEHSKSDYGVLTCMTNRVGTAYQCVGGMWHKENMKAHVDKALELESDKTIIDITNNPPLSGVMIMINKKCWKESGGFADGLLGVDNSIHIRAREKGFKVGLMKGVYLYHYYRNGNRGDKSHLEKKDESK